MHTPRTHPDLPNTSLPAEPFHPIQAPPPAPFRHFNIDTGERHKARLTSPPPDLCTPEPSKLEPPESLADTNAAITTDNPGSTHKPSVTSIYNRSYDIIGSLYCFALKGHLATDEGIAFISLKDAMKFAQKKALALRKDADENSQKQLPYSSTIAFARACAKECRSSIGSEQYELFVTALSNLDFEAELEVTLLHLAHTVLENKKDTGQLRQIATTISSQSDATALEEKLTTMTPQQLASFLKQNWPAIKILSDFRKAIFTEQYDCESSLRHLGKEQLAQIWNSLNDRTFRHLVAHYSKPCFYTNDVANLLENRREYVRAHFINCIVEGFEITLEKFIRETLIEFPDWKEKLSLSSAIWKNTFEEELQPIRQELRQYGLIPNTIDDSAIDRIILLLSLINIPKYDQEDFLAILCTQDLHQLKCTDSFLVLSPASQIQRDLNSLDRLIDLELRACSPSADHLVFAQTAALTVAIHRITEELLPITDEIYAKKIDVPALYSCLHKKATNYLRNLVVKNAIPLTTLNDGSDYATGLILLALTTFRKQDEYLVELIASKLSHYQRASLGTAIPHEQWITTKYIDQDEWNQTCALFQIQLTTSSAKSSSVEKHNTFRLSPRHYPVRPPQFYLDWDLFTIFSPHSREQPWSREGLVSGWPFGKYNRYSKIQQPNTILPIELDPTNIAQQFCELSGAAEDVVGYLRVFAVHGPVSSREHDAILRWDDAIEFANRFLSLKAAQLRLNHNSTSEFTIDDLSCHAAFQCLLATTPEKRDQLRVALSQIDFDREIDEGLRKFVRNILREKDNSSALAKITNLLLTRPTPGAQSQEITDMDELTLFTLLKREWLPVKILAIFRQSILTGGINCELDVRNIPNEILLNQWALINSQEFENLTAWYSKPCFHTQDIATLLHRYAMRIKTELVLRALNSAPPNSSPPNTVLDQLRDFIQNSSHSINKIELDHESWKHIFEGSLFELRKIFALLQIVPTALESPAATDHEIIKFGLLLLSRGEQNAFLEKLSTQELFLFRFANCIITPPPSSSLQVALDAVNRRIDLQIRKRSKETHSVNLEHAHRLAVETDAIVTLRQIKIKLEALANAAKDELIDISAMYAHLHRQVEINFEQHIKRHPRYKAAREEGADYATELLLSGFRTLKMQDKKDHTAHFETLTARLSIEQLAHLGSATTNEKLAKISAYFRKLAEQRI